MSLRKVDKLTITFLVDNTIEWMTKLSPGFTHELPQHLSSPQQSPVDPELGVPVMNFDDFCCGAHGFSALIKTEISGQDPQYTLFDTGPDSMSLVRNLEAMRIPVDLISRVILSHWHSDHSGGLLSFLSVKKASGNSCVVDVHPDRPLSRGIAPGPNYDTIIGALPRDPSFEEISALGGILETHVEEHTVAENTVYVSGEIPRLTSFEIGLLGAMRWTKEDSTNKEGKWIEEPHIMDERYAAIDVLGRGLVIFSACSHAGIVNVVRDAVKRFQRPIHMVVGGLHLAPWDFASRIEPTVRFLSEELVPAPAYVLPMHCTGFHAKVELEHALGDGCVPAGVGIKVEVAGSEEEDKRLSPPRIKSTSRAL